MQALHADGKHEPNTLGLVREIPHSDNASFYEKSQQLGSHYVFIEDDFNNEQKIVSFAQFHELVDFLLWLNQPIEEIFGNVEKTLELFKCWDDEAYHLVLTLCSSLEDMDKMLSLEKDLFSRIKVYKKFHHALHHIVITQD